MSIQEVRQALGSFSIRLRDGVGPDITRRLRLTRGHPTTKGFALVVVTPTRVRVEDYPAPADPATTVHPLLEAARWTGVLRSTGDLGRSLEGQGLESMLTDADGNGHYAVDLTGRLILNHQAWAAIWLLIAGGDALDSDSSTVTFAPTHLRLGHLEAAGPATMGVRLGGRKVGRARRGIRGLFSGGYGERWEPPSDPCDHRSMIQRICDQTGMWYRIRPTGHFDWGHPNDVYGTWPRMVIGRGLPAADDDQWPTLRAELDDWGETTDGWHHGCVRQIQGRDDWWGTPTGRVKDATSYAYHSPLRCWPVSHRALLDHDEDETTADWDDRASKLNAAAAEDNWSATLTGTLTGDPTFAPIPGEPVWLWDPELGIEDPAATITYAGHPIRPQRVPLISSEWEPAEGMGVYLLYCDRSFGVTQQVLDLTDDVDLADERRVTLEVGAPAPTL